MGGKLLNCLRIVYSQVMIMLHNQMLSCLFSRNPVHYKQESGPLLIAIVINSIVTPAQLVTCHRNHVYKY